MLIFVWSKCCLVCVSLYFHFILDMWFITVYYVFLLHIYFILHVILGVSFYLFHFYFLFCCISIQSPNPIHIAGSFAPFASSPPCTHLHTNLQGPITLHLHLADLNFNSTPSHASTCMTKNQFSAHISRFSACGAEDTPTSTCLFLRGGVDNSLQNKGSGFPLFKRGAKVKTKERGREAYRSAAIFYSLWKEPYGETGKGPRFFFSFSPLLLFSLGQLCMETLSLYGCGSETISVNLVLFCLSI